MTYAVSSTLVQPEDQNHHTPSSFDSPQPRPVVRQATPTHMAELKHTLLLTFSICWHHFDTNSSRAATLSAIFEWVMHPSLVLSWLRFIDVLRSRYTACLILSWQPTPEPQSYREGINALSRTSFIWLVIYQVHITYPGLHTEILMGREKKKYMCTTTWSQLRILSFPILNYDEHNR